MLCSSFLLIIQRSVRSFDEGTPLVDQCSEVFGPWRVEVHLLMSAGMYEAERLGMQSLTGTDLEAVVDESLVGSTALSAQYLCSAVSLVAKERVPDVFHVGADLMCASRLENTFHKGWYSQNAPILCNE